MTIVCAIRRKSPPYQHASIVAQEYICVTLSENIMQ